MTSKPERPVLTKVRNKAAEQAVAVYVACSAETERRVGFMRMRDYRGIISANAARLRELNAEIDRTFRAKPHGSEHHAACAAFHSQSDALSFPGGLESSLAKLKTGEPSVVDIAVQYLEVEPRFFRSGYIAETILRRLKHVDLTSDQVTRLVNVILNSIRHGGRRRFVNCARLAGVLKDERISSGALNLSQESDPEIRRRAERVLNIMKMEEKPTPS